MARHPTHNPAQMASEDTNPIRLVFDLVGLYLRVEKHDAGRRMRFIRYHVTLDSGPGSARISLLHQ
jgi:hypothetical protein